MVHVRSVLSRPFVVAALPLVLACSDGMSRDKAVELISQQYGFPTSVTEELPVGNVNYRGGANISAESTLAEMGLITFTYQGESRDMFFSYQTYALALTPEGSKYWTGEVVPKEGWESYVVRLADKVLVDVTGIVEINNGNAAQVDYTWKYDNITPFGTAFGLRNQQVNDVDRANGFGGGRPVYNDGQVYTETVLMVKYDDGWRIQGSD